MGKDEIRAFLDERKSGPLMEIGPLISPFMEKSDYNVYYSDIKSKDEIFELYRSYPDIGLSEQELYAKICPIDFVIKDTYLNAVGDMRFSAILSSHVIEHTHDIIGHLIELGEILTDGGHLVLIIPDKRYCFDHFREVTPFRDALDVHLGGNISRLVFDNAFNHHSENNPFEYWANRVSFKAADVAGKNYRECADLYNSVKESGAAPDSHNWVFTYPSFLDFFRDCLRANLLPFSLHYAQPTPSNSFEFFIILKKDTSILTDSEKRKNEVLRVVELSEADTDNSLTAADLLNSMSWKIGNKIVRFARFFVPKK